jgi:4-hydroxybenzoate polyprenyltransferase
LNITVKEQRRLSQGIFENVNVWLEKIISFLVSSSLFVALSGFSVAYLSFLLFDIEPKLEISFAIFLVTFSVYGINKLTDKKEDSVNAPERTSFTANKGLLLLSLSIISYAIALFLGGSENVLAIPILLIPLCTGTVYSVKIPNFPRLKNILAVKNLTVSLAWAIIAAFPPGIYSFNLILIHSVFYFILIKGFVNTILFDVRDVEGDRKQGVKSIPVTIGIDRTKKLLLLVNSLLIPWLAVSIYLGLFTKYLAVLIFCIIYGYWYIIHFCKERAGKFSYDLVIDGEWILLVFLCFIIRFIPFNLS